MNNDSGFDAIVSGGPPPPRHFNWKRFGKFFGLFILIVGVLAAGTGFFVYKYVQTKFNQAGDKSIVTTGDRRGENLPPAVELKGSVNILVVGSDARDVLDKSDAGLRQYKTKGIDGQRADTMMIIHLTEGGKKAVALSFPRDLRVKVHGRTGYAKINSAYAGGPNGVISTISDLTGIKIDHYVEINFTSFRKIVDAVHGLDLCVDRAYADPQSGLYVSKPGCYNFDGNKSLAYVRMRKSDPEGDFGRIKRQQLFMRALLGKMKSIGFLTDIPAVIHLADAMSKGIKHDNDLSLGLVRTIAQKLAGYGSANVDFRQVPSHPEMIGGVSYVVAEEPYATDVYTAIRNSTALPDVGKTLASLPAPADVVLDIRNASGSKGAAAAWKAKLKKDGYSVRLVESAPKLRTRTQIAFRPGSELKANLLAREFPGAEVVQTVNIGRVVDCVVLLGKDHAADALPKPSPSAAASP